MQGLLPDSGHQPALHALPRLELASTVPFHHLDACGNSAAVGEKLQEPSCNFTNNLFPKVS